MLARRSLIRAVAIGFPAVALLAACSNRERKEYQSGEDEEYSRRQQPRDGGEGSGGSDGGSSGGY